MPKPNKTEPKQTRKLPPAKTPDAREKQMVALAVDLAEQQLRDGTASSQVITHFLKLGSSKEKIEKDIMLKQKDLLEAKTESIKSHKRIEALYLDALNAMRRYSGNDELIEDDEDE